MTSRLFADGGLRVVLAVAFAALAAIVASCSQPTATVPSHEQPVPAKKEAVRDVNAPAGYHLVWADEFDGTELDDGKWHTELTWGSKPESELEEYSPDALSVKDGFLTITASESPGRERPYTSGVIASYGHYDFTYGYVEMRARMAPGAGTWPAFWMLCRNEDLHREIDVTEVIGRQPTRSHMTFHYRVRGALKVVDNWYEGPDLTQDFHTYAVKWTPGKLEWFLDGVKRSEVTHEAVPRDPMYLIANLAIGGRWARAPDETTKFPTQMDIDYIRVFQQD